MKSYISILVVALALVISGSAQIPKKATLNADDLKPLEGKQWVGDLTYLDYGTNKKTTIRSNVTISRSAKKGLTWTFDYQYPGEPNANSKENIVLSQDGLTFDGETVIENTKLADGIRRLVTTKRGNDNDRKALYRFTYEFGKIKFTVRKDVLIDGTTDYFERNTYSWTR